MNLTQYAQKKLLDHTMGLASYTMPTTHLALFTSSPGETGSLSNEVTGGSYARQALAGKLTATVLATGLVLNGTAIAFPAPTGNWGLVTYAGVCDASSAGNVLLYLPLSPGLMVNNGDPALNLRIGAFQLTAVSTDPSQLTQYLAKKWADHILGIASFTAPAGIYLGLFSADPTATGSLANEIATGAYVRQALTASMGATELSTGIAYNNIDVSFPTPTADYTVTHFGILDALSSGNMLLRRARAATLSVKSGRAPVRILSGQLALGAA